MYILSYNVFPYFEDAIYSSYLLGASASVLAIVMATAVREPEYPVQFMFIGTVRLKYVALFMVTNKKTMTLMLGRKNGKKRWTEFWTNCVNRVMVA